MVQNVPTVKFVVNGLTPQQGKKAMVIMNFSSYCVNRQIVRDRPFVLDNGLKCAHSKTVVNDLTPQRGRKVTVITNYSSLDTLTD